MLRSVQNERWNVTGALAELLDEFPRSRPRGNATAVTIFHDLTERTLTVLDNGRGMRTGISSLTFPLISPFISPVGFRFSPPWPKSTRIIPLGSPPKIGFSHMQ